MRKPKTTTWFNNLNEKPVHEGWYEVREHLWFGWSHYKRYWTGTRWAEKKKGRTVAVNHWRGLSEEAK